MSGIKYECKRAIGLINKLIDFYKPINREGVCVPYGLDDYLQQMQSKVSEIIQCTDIIISLNKQIVTPDDYGCCYMVDFVNFDELDELLYNCLFKIEFIKLKDKIKVGLKSLP